MKTSIGKLFLTTSAAAVLSVTATAWSATAPLPPERHYGDVTYLTGGVTEGEAAAFKEALHRYPFAVELLEKAGKKDEYTAEAQVKIVDRDRGKTVLDAKADGPFMLVRLDPGTYDVTAKLGARTLHKSKVAVRKGETAQATFEFPPRTD